MDTTVVAGARFRLAGQVVVLSRIPDQDARVGDGSGSSHCRRHVRHGRSPWHINCTCRGRGDVVGCYRTMSVLKQNVVVSISMSSRCHI